MFLLGIAGGSGSGKTTLTRKILSYFAEDEVASLTLDSYYQNQLAADLMLNGRGNYDHPKAFDWDLLKQHLYQLKQGKSIEVPIYDYENDRRTNHSMRVAPAQVVVLEGIYTLWKSSVRDLLNLKLFVEVDADIRFIRRLHRDVRERGRSLDNVIDQYYATVRPMHFRYLEPTKVHADLIIGAELDRAVEVVAARVMRVLRPESVLPGLPLAQDFVQMQSPMNASTARADGKE